MFGVFICGVVLRSVDVFCIARVVCCTVRCVSCCLLCSVCDCLFCGVVRCGVWCRVLCRLGWFLLVCGVDVVVSSVCVLFMRGVVVCSGVLLLCFVWFALFRVL